MQFLSFKFKCIFYSETAVLKFNKGGLATTCSKFNYISYLPGVIPKVFCFFSSLQVEVPWLSSDHHIGEAFFLQLLRGRGFTVCIVHGIPVMIQPSSLIYSYVSSFFPQSEQHFTFLLLSHVSMGAVPFSLMSHKHIHTYRCPVWADGAPCSAAAIAAIKPIRLWTAEKKTPPHCPYSN